MTRRPTSRTKALGAALRAPWSAKTWLATAHIAVGLLLGLLGTAVVLIALALPLGLGWTVVLAAPAAALLLGAIRLLTACQRSRFQSFLDIDLPQTHDDASKESWRKRQWIAIRASSTWRQATYHVLSLPYGLVAFGLVFSTWALALLLIAAPPYATRVLRWNLAYRSEFDVSLGNAIALMLIGVLLLHAAPWIARGLAWFDGRLAYTLLAPSGRDNLAERVTTLTASRADLISAADAERRRIERDLHDGAQQQLVALAVKLGVARATLTDLSPEAHEAIVSAHEQAKQALVELRNLVRGMHPAVLNDLGLEAALTGIAAVAPVPVRLDVNVEPRPSPAIEAVAYFVVSEALTNVAKHAHASTADVTVNRINNRLRLTIADDGQGGASIGVGTGLPGLLARVHSVDGTLQLESPVGGPTTITAELPCE